MQKKKGSLLVLSVLVLMIAVHGASAEENQTNTNITFILGTDINEEALQTAASNSTIDEKLNVTVYTKNDTIPQDTNFSQSSVIFIESRNETFKNEWNKSINSAKDNGTSVIGYNLSSNVTSLSNVDLYSNNYTEIERYWIQDGDTNMKNMLKTMGQKFCEQWVGENITEPEIIHPETNVTYILNSDNSVYYLNQVLSERDIITDRFDVTVMDGQEASENLTDVSDQDVIMLYMIGSTTMPDIKDPLLEAKDNGTQIGLFGMQDNYDVSTIDMEKPPHNAMKEYLYNSSFSNMEHWIRYIGAEFEDDYIEYKPSQPPEIPDHGIYHPDAFPRIFENSTTYFEWYKDHGYNESAPTIGIIDENSLGKSEMDYNADDDIIQELESKGCNVIYTTSKVCEEDVDYFTNNGSVIVDTIISNKGFYLNYGDQEKGVDYLEEYNVPVIKAVFDYYNSPADYNASTHGVNPQSLAFQVTQPEIDGATEYIWVAGRVQDPDNPDKYYYKAHDQQVDWLTDRAISWSELGRTDNSDKNISIIYYNHGGGKSNIGASYMDIVSSFELLLQNMNNTGYDIGERDIPNGSKFIDLFIESRNVGSWAPGELEKVVESGNVTLVPKDEYMEWYNNLPESVREDVEDRWGEPPGDIMVYKDNFVIPAIQMGNVNFIPQPMRGDLSDESTIYHDKELPPTHHYLATYFWINQVNDADAMIHFGTHGTQEWLPGKEVGLWKYDYPSIMVGNTPVIYPYIMDNVGEGTQAKRRGNAVIIDHLTPPISSGGLYGNLSQLHEKIHSYETAENGTKSEYRETIIELYSSLNLEADLGVTSDEMKNMNSSEFSEFVNTDIHDHLHKLKNTLMPLGLHTFGVAPEGEELVYMVKSMMGQDFIEHIMDVLPQQSDEEDMEIAADENATKLLNATILNGTNVTEAQEEVLNTTDTKITEDLNTALNYSTKLQQTSREIDQTLKTMDAEFIEPGPGNDPIRNPEALPTGRNFYSFDPRKFPDKETEDRGAELADQMLDKYKSEHGDYPKKVNYVLWSVETMRHEGLMEAQIYSLLGVEPRRDLGRIVGFDVIPAEEMDHPRIDVTVTPSGLYRDTFPYQLELIDEAVRTVAALNESNETNYVRMNSLKMEEELKEMGYNNSTAVNLSRSRIFSESPGSYGTGLPGAVTASDTWENEDELADLYMSRMSNIYGQNNWGENYEDVFKLNLRDVEVAQHSDSSNLYGLIDNDDFYQYLGGVGLAVRSLTGEKPEMYVADFKDADNPQITTLNEAFRTELRSRYFNPTWISGMMEHDYAGAREFMKFTEHMWGWDAVSPELVTDSDWNEMYDIYVKDKYDLGMNEFMKSENPYQYQSTTARMLETSRKIGPDGNAYWQASDKIVNELVKEYVDSVVENGVTCCHHTCGNPTLNEYVEGQMSVAGISPEKQEAYKKLMDEATEDTESGKKEDTKSEDSLNSMQREMVNSSNTATSNQTQETESESGTGADTGQDPGEKQSESSDDYVEGYEMEEESKDSDSSSSPMSFSGADMVGTVLVLLAVSAIVVGYMRRT
ncbi:MAG: cobaltochelatase subunit CobN [Methanohalobium sp.]|uniref:cobaltochelatase subunit CobN n=1 Tax=Methanohalobium sp. TaxID=2837493 RepID=UPI00397CBDED